MFACRQAWELMNHPLPAESGFFRTFYGFLDGFQDFFPPAISVEVQKTSTEELLWEPEVLGRKVVLTDTSRTVVYLPPYANTPAGPTVESPQEVHPSSSLYFIPRKACLAGRNWFARHQPGDLLGVIGQAFVFQLQAPQSGDTDDGQLIELAIKRLPWGYSAERVFPGDLGPYLKASGALPDRIRMERGVLEVLYRTQEIDTAKVEDFFDLQRLTEPTPLGEQRTFPIPQAVLILRDDGTDEYRYLYPLEGL